MTIIIYVLDVLSALADWFLDLLSSLYMYPYWLGAIVLWIVWRMVAAPALGVGASDGVKLRKD